jgi:ferrochelatase
LEELGHPWAVVYQSRSGSPSQPWLGPDILDVIADIDKPGDVVVAPIGFVSDHMEVVYDLDVQARETARNRGLRLTRSATPGLDPRFVHMVCELIDELEHPGQAERRALGSMGPWACPAAPDCCPPAGRLDSPA